MKIFELVFSGAAVVREYKIPRHRRFHRSLESATAAARRVWEEMSRRNLPAAAHTPIVYGPGCGPDGKSVQPW